MLATKDFMNFRYFSQAARLCSHLVGIANKLWDDLKFYD